MENLFDLAFWFSGVILSFNASMIFDGLFVIRGEREIHLTPIGWLYYGGVLFVVNFFASLVKGIFRLITRLITKSKSRGGWWVTLVSLKKANQFLSFGNGVGFYLGEIITGLIVGFCITPLTLRVYEVTQWVIVPILFGALGGAIVLFFRALPFKKKSRLYVVLGWSLIVISTVIFGSILYNLIPLSQSVLNATLNTSLETFLCGYAAGFPADVATHPLFATKVAGAFVRGGREHANHTATPEPQGRLELLAPSLGDQVPLQDDARVRP